MARIFNSLINKNARIAVLCGGKSNEKNVSIRSGQNVLKALLKLGYINTILMEVDDDIAKNLKDKKIEIAYNALHGKYGEDGCIQGVLEILGIKYTGCGVMASSVCMNKHYTKEMLKTTDVSLIKSVLVRKNDNLFEKIKNLKFPLMIKPVSEGSSIGMFKVSDKKELEEKFTESAKIGQDILIEEFLVGKCATVGVLENGDETFATAILELRPKKEWYDYEAKYTKGLTEFILPAEFSEKLSDKIKKDAITAFRTCGCSGVSRVDFLVVGDVPYILEINTSPGMTDLSDLPAQSAVIDISYEQLVQLTLNSASLNK